MLRVLVLRAYARAWEVLPPRVRSGPAGRAFGRHIHAVVRHLAPRYQSVATFFLRNRPELTLLQRLIRREAHGSNLRIAVLAASKGAEVYSIVWAIRSVRSDLRLTVHAIDISREALRLAEAGTYWLGGTSPASFTAQITEIDQNDASIFERMSSAEMQDLFMIDGNLAVVRPQYREGIMWHMADATNPSLLAIIGKQDYVFANRFLCHMQPREATAALRNIARLVDPGGYLFVSGLDLKVRARLARRSRWISVPDSISEIHNGDPSLLQGWPLAYWGLEPFVERLSRSGRYASVFRIMAS